MTLELSNSLPVDCPDSESDDDSEPASDPKPEPNEAPNTQSDVSDQDPTPFPEKKEENGEPTQPKTDGDLHIQSVIECDCVAMTCQFSTDGSLLAVGLCNGTIKVYSTDSGELTQTLRDNSSVISGLPVTGLRFTCSGNLHHLLLATYASGCVRCWYVWGGQCVWWLKESKDSEEDEDPQPRESLCLSTSLSGERAVTGGSDATVHLYDLNTCQRLQVCRASASKAVMDGHRFRIFAVSFHPERETEFITGGWDNTVQFWDTRMQHSIRMLYGPHVCGDALHINPASNQILSGSWRRYNTLEVWDYDSGRKVSEVPQDPHENSRIYTCYWSGQDHLIGGGGQANILRVVNHHSLETESRLFDLSSAVYSSSVCLSGQWAGLIAASSGKQVFLLHRNQNTKKHQ
ncbi:WD repeat-containing protein 5B [Astyanax mexicanus]|uniref:WD repeat-containing protein 5B-like n=1 Tax=Astyanax mexicanus TaxID=7994 RepID=A0A3B1IMU9_ASTMX|nr:WD repeat-containing protein 5B [Astyanax mexicanus]